MSIPISSCVVYKAALGDEQAYESLVNAYKINLACGHYSRFGCSCNPPCEVPTKEQMEVLQKRLDDYFKENPVKETGWPPSGPMGAVGMHKV
jgi:hypothetical protein